MPFYAVTFSHHDLDVRARHLEAHLAWLKQMVADGHIRLSGPLTKGPLADSAPVVALLILKTEDKASAMEMIASDPFFIHGSTGGLTVTEWDPIFGQFAEESSGASSVSPSP